MDLDPDEAAALDGIVRFIVECRNESEIIAALILAECAADARKFAAEAARMKSAAISATSATAAPQEVAAAPVR